MTTDMHIISRFMSKKKHQHIKIRCMAFNSESIIKIIVINVHENDFST